VRRDTPGDTTGYLDTEFAATLGWKAKVCRSETVAIGSGAYAKGYRSIAIGRGSISGTIVDNMHFFSLQRGSIAIGTFATALQLNSTALGYNATTIAANQIQLGNAAVSSLRCQVALTVVSDQRDKTNIEPIHSGNALNFVTSLNPVKFNFDSRSCYPDGVPDGTCIDPTQRVGFLAQDILECQANCNVEYLNIVQGPDIIPLIHEGNITGNIEQYSVITDHLHPVYVNAFKELKGHIESLEILISSQNNIIANLESRIIQLETAT